MPLPVHFLYLLVWIFCSLIPLRFYPLPLWGDRLLTPSGYAKAPVPLYPYTPLPLRGDRLSPSVKAKGMILAPLSFLPLRGDLSSAFLFTPSYPCAPVPLYSEGVWGTCVAEGEGVRVIACASSLPRRGTQRIAFGKRKRKNRRFQTSIT